MAGLEDPLEVPAAPAGAEEFSGEVDVWWGSYSGRAMAPHLALCVLVSAAILTAAFFLGAWLDTRLARWVAQGLMLLLWLALFGTSISRCLGVNYRLTNRRLYVQRGFRHPAEPGLEIARIRNLEIRQSPAEAWLGVGRIVIDQVDAQNPRRILAGVYEPQTIVRLLRLYMNR